MLQALLLQTFKCSTLASPFRLVDKLKAAVVRAAIQDGSTSCTLSVNRL